jgi:malonyl-CoA O-methyltransferase
MGIQKAYDQWSTTYDTDENFTRDLDQIVTQETLSEYSCQRILEIGCGTGKNTDLLAKIAQNVCAIDFSQGMMKKARTQIQAKNVAFCLADLTQGWAIKDQTMDLIVCNLVLEHIENLKFIFCEATRVLVESGKFFISELHPFKQYQGIQANFQQAGKIVEVPAYLHHMSDFLEAAKENGLRLLEINERWHEADHNKPPRLVTFVFEK